jgi:hypothetical protein
MTMWLAGAGLNGGQICQRQLKKIALALTDYGNER